MSNVAKITSVAPVGYDGHIIEVESDMTKGLPGLQIVGMGNKAIDEAKERVKSAITNSLLEYPTKRITINLAPAELPKDGTHYDLAIALSILASSGQLNYKELSYAVFAGELALDGQLRSVRGIVTIVEAAKSAGYSTVYVPKNNVVQAQLVPDIEIIGVPDLKSLFLHLKKELVLQAPELALTHSNSKLDGSLTRLDDVFGQDQAKRALVIATAGRHNILLAGPPGAGKTMLARTAVSILPDLTQLEKLSVTKLHSLAGEAVEDIIATRPFRAPHHTSSRVSLIGGGAKPKPGEVSLAHLGVLFLDEIPEYPRSVLESLRQPLEDKMVSVTRANGRAVYPADFMLIATMNPCPCGYYGDDTRECTCTSAQILLYQKRLSGPLLDRIDMKVTVSRVPHDTLLKHSSLNYTQHDNAVKDLTVAINKQTLRYKSSTKNNGNISSKEIKKYISLSDEVHTLLISAADKLNLSARSYFKVIKVARTIADLENSDAITTAHLSEALQYR